ncbi:hypothetical protein NT04LM_3170a, partial [Listeria monocytogenes FSL F2-208]
GSNPARLILNETSKENTLLVFLCRNLYKKINYLAQVVYLFHL